MNKIYRIVSAFDRHGAFCYHPETEALSFQEALSFYIQNKGRKGWLSWQILKNENWELLEFSPDPLVLKLDDFELDDSDLNLQNLREFPFSCLIEIKDFPNFYETFSCSGPNKIYARCIDRIDFGNQSYTFWEFFSSDKFVLFLTKHLSNKDYKESFLIDKVISKCFNSN
jgi:hypothetical protein